MTRNNLVSMVSKVQLLFQQPKLTGASFGLIAKNRGNIRSSHSVILGSNPATSKVYVGCFSKVLSECHQMDPNKT